MSFLIKICGITTADDARMVGEAGVDAIGVNFWPASRRFVGERAGEVLAAIPPGVLKVGVFVNAPADDVLKQARRFGLDRVQLHGDEIPTDYQAIPPSLLVRAIRVRGATSLAEVATWQAGLFLYDAFGDGYGGAGVTAPWAEIAAATEAARASSGPARPFLLAGGLDAHNVARAIALTRPDGVDVASGVERSPGRKDPALVAAFVHAARAAAETLPR